MTRKKERTIYKYAYPGFQYASMSHYKCFEDLPIIEEIVRVIEKDLLYDSKQIVVIQAIGTRYIRMNDNRGFHYDKVRDIMENSSILNLSLGNIRELHLLNNATNVVSNIIVFEPGS